VEAAAGGDVGAQRPGGRGRALRPVARRAEKSDAAVNARTLVKQQQEALGLSLPGLPATAGGSATPSPGRRADARAGGAVGPRALHGGEPVAATLSREFVVDFPTLFVAHDWAQAHCVVPDGFRKGEPFELVDWQAWCLLNFYRLKPTAKVGQLAPAFHYRRAQIVLPAEGGQGAVHAAHICVEAVGPALFAGWARAARSGTAATRLRLRLGLRVPSRASRWACRGRRR
jgi:hypothetical protein